MKKDFDSKIKKQVVVIGGGTAGFPAAVASARNGANTLLVERFQYLGGNMTGGLMLSLHTMRIHKDMRRINDCQEVGYQSKQVIRGMCMEIHDRLIDMGAAYGRKGEASSRVQFDGEAMKFLADQMVQEAGVEVWLQSLVTDVIMEDKTVKGVVVENKSGRHLIEADVFVDASGDADVAYLAGAPYEKGRKEDARTMPMTLMFIMDNVNLSKTIEYLKRNPVFADLGVKREQLYKEGKPITFEGSASHCFSAEIQRAHENGDFPLAIGAESPVPLFVFWSMFRMGAGVVHSQTLHVVDMIYSLDGSNARDLTTALFHTRKKVMAVVKFLNKYIPGFENAYLLQTADQLGIRETRRIVGDYVLTKDDVLEARKFEDKIAQGGRAVNVHSEVGGKKEQIMGGQAWLEIKGDEPYDIPYRSLLPSGVDGLIVAGRCISVDHMALGSLRGEPLCIATGEAAGTAAALAVRQKANPRQVKIKTLQDMLMSQGVDLGQGV